MVEQVRSGLSQRAVAARMGVSLATVQWWLERAGDARLDRVDWSTHEPIAHRVQRVSSAVEDLVLSIRQELRTSSDLGEYGAVAIRRELQTRAGIAVPGISTISRILVRRGAVDAGRRVRRPPPPRGWYLPPSGRHHELDSFDVVDGLKIQNGPLVEVLNGVSLHGGLAVSWPVANVSARFVVQALEAHWRHVGLPAYAQFDNDTRFQGAHQHRDSIGRVMRLCLSLGVVPVFAPPRETGFQAAIEGYNALWQAKVWARFQHPSLAALQAGSERYCLALCARRAARIEAAPARRAFPADWVLDLQQPPRGQLIYIRRTTEDGAISLLGHRFDVSRTWTHRLVRCEVDLEAHAIRIFALRRRAPAEQPLLRDLPYTLPPRRFQG